MAHVIAVTNQKGGVGKTTTAINLGAALAEMGHYTLLGDLDPQGGLSLGLELAAHDLDLTIYNILTDTRIPVAGVTHHIRAHLDLLPSNIDLAVAEFQLIAQMGREYILREALQSVRNQYEYIILDCPPSLNLLTVNALTAADAIIVPLQVEYFAMRGLEQLMDVVSRVRRRLNPSLEIIGIVPTMVDVRRTNDQQIIQEVTKAYPGMLIDVYVKESIKFADAPRHQRSIMELDPRHDGAHAYRQLARLVLTYYGDAVEPEPDRASAETAEAAEAPPTPGDEAIVTGAVAALSAEMPPEEPIAEPAPEALTQEYAIQEPITGTEGQDLTREYSIEQPDGETLSELVMPEYPFEDPEVEAVSALLAVETPTDFSESETSFPLPDVELPLNVPDGESPGNSPPPNGAYPSSTDSESPSIHELIQPTRDVPRDMIL